MNKPVLGIVVGGMLGLLDGFAAPLQVSEIAPEAMGIVIGSTFKGVIVGLIAGFFARKVRSVPLGIAVGLLAGLGFAYLIASQPDALTGKHYYREIMLPGSLAGAIVGFVTQRYGRRPGVAATAALLLILVPAAGWAQTAALAATAADGPKAFERLKTLVGDWEGHVTSPDGPKTRVEFRLVGNGSALVERLFPGTDHEMVSVYHLVGSELVLTHYCAMANQPRMKLAAGGHQGDLVFEFAGGSNIDPETTTHMHGGRFAVKDPNSYEAEWRIVSQGKPAGSNRFFMERAATAQAR